MIGVVLAWVVVVLHVIFAYAEAVAWSQMGRRFGLSAEAVEHTRQLAKNQGAYNFGLAVVLGWALATGEPHAVTAMLLYVVAMAVVGAATVRWTIFIIQGVPAVLALLALTLM